MAAGAQRQHLRGGVPLPSVPAAMSPRPASPPANAPSSAPAGRPFPRGDVPARPPIGNDATTSPRPRPLAVAAAGLRPTTASGRARGSAPEGRRRPFGWMRRRLRTRRIRARAAVGSGGDVPAAGLPLRHRGLGPWRRLPPGCAPQKRRGGRAAASPRGSAALPDGCGAGCVRGGFALARQLVPAATSVRPASPTADALPSALGQAAVPAASVAMFPRAR